jgi:WD40 repeat protein
MRHAGPVEGALALPDGRILSWSSDNTLRLWASKTGAQVGPTLGDERVDPMPNVSGVGIRGALVMPDGRILSWYDDGALRLWDVKTGRQVGLAMRLAEGGTPLSWARL